MFDIVSVLPRHSTQFELALERASMWVAETSGPVRVWNPDTCPPEFLPWLAWALSVDNWRSDWGIETKRAVIRNSVEIHRRKGTLGAVRRALSSVGFDAEIFEPREAAHIAPKSFHLVSVFPESATLTAKSLSDGVRDARGAIDATKPASVIYDISVGQSIPIKRRIGGSFHGRLSDARTPKVSANAQLQRLLAGKMLGHIRHKNTILGAKATRTIGVSMFTRMEAV